MSEELYSYYDIACLIWENLKNDFKIKLDDERLYVSYNPQYKNVGSDRIFESIELYLVNANNSKININISIPEATIKDNKKAENPYDEVFNKEEYESMADEYTNKIINFIKNLDGYDFDVVEIKNE